jgi:hypothetical protein
MTISEEKMLEARESGELKPVTADHLPEVYETLLDIHEELASLGMPIGIVVCATDADTLLWAICERGKYPEEG